MRAQLHTLEGQDSINIDLPEAEAFRRAHIALSVHSHIHSVEWRAHLGYNERGHEVTCSVFSTNPDPAKSLRDLYALCV
jgi:hypothetical protein